MTTIIKCENCECGDGINAPDGVEISCADYAALTATLLVPFALPVRVAKHPAASDVFPWTIVDANGVYVIGVYQQSAAEQLVALLNRVARTNPSATALFPNNQIHPLFAGIIRQHFPWVTEDDEGKLAPGAQKIKDLHTELQQGENPITPTVVWSKPLTPCGDADDPLNKLSGTVYIANTMFHVEANEVYYIDGIQHSKQDSDSNYFEEVLNIVQGSASTVDINGREYVLHITPSQK